MKKMWRKSFACFLAVIMAVCSFAGFLPGAKLSFNASAAAEAQNEVNGFSFEVLSVIAEGIYLGVSEVDVSRFCIDVQEAAELMEAAKIYYSVIYGESCEGSFAYDVTHLAKPDNFIVDDFDYIIRYKFTYGDNLDSSTYGELTDEIDEMSEEILEKTEGMTDFEKLLYIHDYLVLNTEYCTDASEWLPITEFSIYGLLGFKNGVCQAYETAYSYFLSQCSIETASCHSSPMFHIWNYVKLDGEWYHVDVTWDDPLPDRKGLSRYTYFLLNDDEISAGDNPHYDWDSDIVASDTTYSNMPRRTDTARTVFRDGRWYYVDSSRLYSCDRYGNDVQLISDSYSYTTMSYYDGNFYATSGNKLYRINGENMEDAGLIYILPETPRSIYIDKDGEFTYFTNSVKRSEIFNVEDYGYITGIEIEQQEISLLSGDSFRLKAAVINETANGEDFADNITFRTSSSAVAEVSSDGTVTGKFNGTAKITASFDQYSASCNVTVSGAKDRIIEGTCTDTITWKLDTQTGQIDITGTGAIPTVFSNTLYWLPYMQSVKSINIGDGITKIGQSAFSGGVNVESVYIPKSVTEISGYVFSECTSLKTIILPFVGASRDSDGTAPSMFGFIFGYMLDGGGTAQYYKRTDTGSLYYYEFGIPTTLEKVVVYDDADIPFGAFSNCTFIDEVVLGEAVCELGEYAFYGNYGTKVTFENENCYIPDSSRTLTSSNTVRGYEGSTAQSYATAYNRRFELIEVEHTHNYEANVTKPSCNQQGYTTYICGCGDSYTDNVVEATEHKLGEYFEIEKANCFFGGTEKVECALCGYSETREAPAKGHILGEAEMIEGGSCNEGGKSRRDCENCDYYEISEIEASGHNYAVAVTEPTCTEDGYTTYVCTKCSDTYTGDTVTAKGHSVGAYTEYRKATCSAKGEERAYCSECDYYESRETAKLEHSYTATVTEPTCTEDGYTAYSCTVCSYSYTDNTVAAKGHSDSNSDGLCDSCGAGIREENCDCMCHKSGFMGFIYKIVRFFWRLFKMNKTCGCGVVHY